MAVDLDDTILATSRVVMKGPYGIPIQYALREDTGEQIKLGGSNIAEMNSFAATSISAGIQVLLLSAEFIVRRKFDETYGLYDSERPAMGRLYDRLGAKDSVEHSYRIYFPDYGKEKNSKLIPTYWKIQVSDMEKLIANKCH
ncbi:hypothetical protein CH379_016045 [Leptospira ellisii]|nr:hypothetical protein [Leptospira ellisii]MDV6237144.1 hypothetical protein [Leptospira ellisii]